MEAIAGIDPLEHDGDLVSPPASLTPEWMRLPEGWLEAAGRTGAEDFVVTDGWDRPATSARSARKAARSAGKAGPVVAISTIVSGNIGPGKEKAGPTAFPISLAASLAAGTLSSWAWYQGVLRLGGDLPWAPIFVGVLVSWTMRLGVRRRDSVRIASAVAIVLTSALSVMAAVSRFGEITPLRTRNLKLLRFPVPANPIEMVKDVHSLATSNALPAVLAMVGLVVCGVMTSYES